MDDECNWSIHPVSDKLMLGGHKIEEQAEMLSTYYGVQETPWSQISNEHRKILQQGGGWDSTTYTAEFITGNAEDVAGTVRDPAVWIVGIVSIAKLAPTAREVVAYLGALCVSNPICATLVGNSANDPDGDPLPPGWNENWELEYGVRGNTPHWWDELGGEWRWHAVDQWHSRGHWDYNPWTHWNSPWQNIYPGGGSIP